MAHLYRLGAAVLLALTLAMIWTPARADFNPPPGGTEYQYATGQDIGEWLPSQMGACQSWASIYNGRHSAQVVISPTSINEGGHCLYSYQYTVAGGGSSGTDGDLAGGSRVVAATCPANSTGTTSCVCNAGYVENSAHNGCTLPQQTCGDLGTPVAGSSSSSQYTGSGNYAGGVLCRAGCKVYPGSSWKGVDGKWYASGPLTNVGGTCSAGDGGAGGGNDTPTAGTPPLQCPVGKCPGQINGTDVCVPCATGITESTTATTTTIAGTGTAGPGSGAGTGSGEGAGTTGSQGTSQTSCTGNSCTTTTTATRTNPDGSTGTAVITKQEPKDDFCTKNPRSPLCVNSSFSGSCAGGFSGEGDPLQVAMAKEQHERNCTLFDKVTPESAEYHTLKNKEGAQYENSDVNISSSSFDQSNALGVGATCVTDKAISINVAGHTFAATLPLSRVCPYLAWLGYFNLAIAFVLAARIVGRG
jgi:hypothetical protein